MHSSPGGDAGSEDPALHSRPGAPSICQGCGGLAEALARRRPGSVVGYLAHYPGFDVLGRARAPALTQSVGCSLGIVNRAGRGFDVDPGVARCVELVQLPAAHPQVETESLSSECASQLVCRGLNDSLCVGGRCIGQKTPTRSPPGTGLPRSHTRYANASADPDMAGPASLLPGSEPRNQDALTYLGDGRS